MSGEPTGKNTPETHDDERNNEARERAVRMYDDTGDGGEHEKDVADESDNNGYTDGLESSPSRIGEVRAKQWNDKHPEKSSAADCRPLIERRPPERVECAQASGSLLTQAKST